ncbi:hypothetical protein [Vibrio penaeicida]|uniref:Restriction endonuclease n=1 Tax=Vibrio penaeicida TaxID=104609 RepID=A0AAV5NKV7_9VIBR|nr:hypothetical protein [Vibrio penaeicida]RTZ24873.1 hypothetical protein EKN09_00980 [Vibrio penaeicida]GLQ71244.1 hypothetical protein GCM10007932_06040 [Vibrio penaeicida]
MRDKQIAMSESELAEIGGRFFEYLGYNLYPEVVIPNFNGRPDYIGVKGSLVAAFEYKKSLGFNVLEQLTRWHSEYVQALNSEYMDESKKGIPHLLIAVTQKPNSHSSRSRLKQEIIDQYRLGHFEISKLASAYCHRRDRENIPDGQVYSYYESSYKLHQGGFEYELREITAPRIQTGSRRTAHRIALHLNPDMKIGQAGTSGAQGGYMTPFRRTMLKVKNVLERGGDWLMTDILEVVNNELGGHHYCSDTSARSGISKLIEELEIGTKVNEYPPKYRLFSRTLTPRKDT